MRVLLGRLALLLGVLLVAGAGWYGATTLLGDDGTGHGSSSAPPACAPATRKQAQAANHAFRKKYAWTPWLSGFGVSDTHSVRSMAEEAGPENVRVPELDGDGFLVLVVVTRRAPLDQLPGCLLEVPVAYATTGRARAD